MDDADLRSGVIAGTSAYLLWGALTVYWKQLDGFEAFDLIGWRVTSSSVLMALLLTWRRRWKHLLPVLRDRRLLLRVCATAVLLTVNWTAYVYAVVHGHVIETALGYFIAPLGAILVGVRVYGETLHRSQRIAVVLALGAIGVLTVSYGHVPWLALAIAVSWSLYGWLKKLVPLTPVESTSAESFALLLPALVTVAVLARHQHSILHSADATHVLLVSSSGFATVIPLMLFAWAAPRVPLTLLGPMQYAVPTINFLLGWLAYDEAMTPARLVGFSLVWIGLALVSMDTVRRARRSVPSWEPISA